MFAKAVWDFYNLGLSPIPLGHWSTGPKGDGQAPKVNGWQKYCGIQPTKQTIEEWVKKYPDNNIGLCMGTMIGELQLIGVDIDMPEFREKIERALGDLKCGKVGSKGATWFFRGNPEMPKKSIKHNKQTMVDILAGKGQTVIPPSIHPKTQNPYTWIGQSLLEIGLENLPVLSDGAILEIMAIAKGEDQYFNGGTVRQGINEEILDGINNMTTTGGRGGGTTHDNRLRCSAYMVTTGWSDDDAVQRLDRAMREAYERAGILHEFDVDAVHHEHRQMVESARAKGFGDKAAARAAKIPKERTLADWAKLEYEPLQFVQGKFLHYDSGHWSPISDMMIKRGMLELDSTIKSSDVNAAMSNLSVLANNETFGSKAVDKICLQNGTLVVSSMDLKQHEPDDEILHQLDFDWEGEKECPVYEGFINWIFGDQPGCVDCFEEFAGLTLVDDLRYQKMMFLTGRGQNGKSTLADLLMSLHADSAVSTVPITALDDERQRTSLVGALVNVSTEQSRLSTMADAAFKQIVAGDPVSVRRLYEEVQNKVKLKVRLLCLANDLPALSDSGFAMRRRMIILPCPNVIPDSEKDPDLIYKLKAERPGILYRWVKALQRLRARGKFDEPEVSVDAVDAYMKENDSVSAWVDNKMLKTTDSWMVASEAYEDYSEFAKRLGFRFPYRYPQFKSKLKDYNIPIKVETHTSGGVVFIEERVGLRYKDQSSAEMLKRL